MNLLIDSAQLEIKVLKKKEYIDAKPTCFDAIMTTIGFVLNAVASDLTILDQMFQNVLRIIFVMIGICYFIKLIRDYIRYYVNKYTHEMLLEDIKGMNKITHPFSIIAIKDTFKEHSNRFLVYYDERWNCRLFPYFRTVENDNENYVLEKLSGEFKLDKKDITIKYQTNEIHEKYSVSDQVNKTYSHMLYKVELKAPIEVMKQDTFKIGNKEYFWMTIEDMMKNSRIKEHNEDVVRFVELNIS